MARNIDGREYLIIPTDDELTDAWQQCRALVARRVDRGQVEEDAEGHFKVNGLLNAEQILADNPHIERSITELGVVVSANIEAGRITPNAAFQLGAKHILEMFSIATTACEASEIDSNLDDL